MERLPHFAELSLDSETDTQATFGRGLAMLLDRLAGEIWEAVQDKNWSASLYVDMSMATITAEPSESDIAPEDHVFSAFVDVPDDQPMKDSLPYFGGLETSSKIRGITLFRIAKVILAGEPDPLDEIKKSFKGDQ